MKTLQQVKNELKNYDGDTIKIMEVCGTHTASIFKNGIRSLISPKIKLISGPGCPVCVTSAAYIDKLVESSQKEHTCILTFGDMMKVKGSHMSLTEAKAAGANVSILYSPLAAIGLAMENPATQYIFAAVGFETTTPIYGLLLEEIIKNKITNLKLLTSIKTMIPALTFICESGEKIDGFLCPGHVSVITGSNVYKELSQTYQKPFVVTGFEGEHIIASIYEIVNQLKHCTYQVKNLYENAVSAEGNQRAVTIIDKYFEPVDDTWRGIGMIPQSALRLKKEYQDFDAGSELRNMAETFHSGCRCKEVILGRIEPVECPLFQTVCTPFHAIGPCMVSSEGACGIWYKHRNHE